MGVRAVSGIRRKTLTEEVYEAIKDRILRREMKSGERLVEHRLATEFGVSKTPVREAMSRLEKEGLLHLTPHCGAVVARLTATQAANLLDLRELLEGFAAERAAESIDRRRLEALDGLIHDAEAALDENNLERYTDVDIKLHRLVREASGNEELAKVLASIEDQIRIVMSTSVGLDGRARESLAEHRALYRALVRRDGFAAREAAQQHIRRVREAILEHLRVQEEVAVV